MIHKLGPVSFDFAPKWIFEIRECDDKPLIKEAFYQLRLYYEEIAEAATECDDDRLKKWCEADYELMMHTARVKCFDLHWIRETFEGISLADLSLAIAETYYPSEDWEILEQDEDAVVTNSDRSRVFDLKYFDVLSPKAAIGLCDPNAVLDRKTIAEVTAFRTARLRRTLNQIEMIKEDIRRADETATLIPISE